MNILLFAFLASMSAWGQAPNQATIDRYVEAALGANPQVLRQTSGRFECGFVVIHSQQGRGETLEIAQTRAQLLCIREQCEKSDQLQLESLERLRAQSDEELGYLLESNGHPRNTHAETIRNIREHDYVPGSVNCRNDSYERMLAFDSCFAVPMRCSRG